MNRSDNKLDDQWLAALAGHPDPEADPTINQQASVLRKAYFSTFTLPLASNKNSNERIRLAELHARAPKNDDALYQQILIRLEKEQLLKSTDSVIPNKHPKTKFWTTSWKAVLAYIAAAFIFGLLTARITLIPVMQGVKSLGPEIVMVDGNYLQKVTLVSEDPASFIKRISAEAIDADINLTVEKQGGRFFIALGDFVPYSAKQERIRETLGVTGSIAGKVLFVVIKSGEKENK